jgi:quercetin dioxygenase-like cupin family protein
MTTRAPQHHRWTDLSSQTLTESVQRRYVTADRVTVARFELKKGGVVPRHAHENEQVSCVLTGALRFQFDEREIIVGTGEVMQIPGGIAHAVTALQDTVVIDVFSPVRQDWIDGTDTYFKRRD